MNPFVAFVLQYKFVFIFYLLIVLFLLFNHKKLEVQAKFIVLYRMKLGLKTMERIAGRFREWVILYGYVGVGAGFVGLIAISYLLIKNLYTFLRVPDTASAASFVYPGMSVPGLGVLPFWTWLLALFLIAAIHEFSHGVVARAHKIEVKNTGLVFLGPILGAFVEPDENSLRKQKDITQYSVLAAGSSSNIILAVIALLCLNLVFFPLAQTMTEPTGFTFDAYTNTSYPFASAGVAPGTIITALNTVPVRTFEEFSTELQYHQPGDTIVVATAEKKKYEVTLMQHPDNSRKPFLGILGIRNEVEIKDQYQQGFAHVLYRIVDWFQQFSRWLFVLSFGVGLFNLLPLPIVDGGRMAQVFLHKLKGAVVGEKRYRQISLFFLILLLLNLVFPLVAKLF